MMKEEKFVKYAYFDATAEGDEKLNKLLLREFLKNTERPTPKADLSEKENNSKLASDTQPIANLSEPTNTPTNTFFEIMGKCFGIFKTSVSHITKKNCSINSDSEKKEKPTEKTPLLSKTNN